MSVKLVFKIALHIFLIIFSRLCLLSILNVQTEVVLIFTAYIYMQVLRIYTLLDKASVEHTSSAN